MGSESNNNYRNRNEILEEYDKRVKLYKYETLPELSLRVSNMKDEVDLMHGLLENNEKYIEKIKGQIKTLMGAKNFAGKIIRKNKKRKKSKRHGEKSKKKKGNVSEKKSTKKKRRGGKRARTRGRSRA